VGSRPHALSAAIDVAWRVFDMPAPPTTGVCERCCMDPQIEADFLKRSPRELPAPYVRDWYAAACDGSLLHDHVAWFLPRVMELLADGDDVAPFGRQVALNRLPLAGYPTRWRADEVDAVEAFAQALFAAVLNGDLPVRDDTLDSWLCLFGAGGVAVRPLLAQLEALPVDRLAALLHRDWLGGTRRAICVDGFWGDSPAKAQVWDWYTSDAMLDRLTEAMLAGNEQAVDLYDLILDARLAARSDRL
jgi:hypothetical protein